MRRPSTGKLLPLPPLPSNDNDPNVQIEILAAELGQSPEVWARWHNCDREIEDDLTALGVRGFMIIGAFGGSGKSIPSFQDAIDERDYWAGWLAGEFVGFNEPADALDWDPTRPLAEQWPWNGEARITIERVEHGIADLFVDKDPIAGYEARVLAAAHESARVADPDIDAIEYEVTRAAEPDPRDEYAEAAAEEAIADAVIDAAESKP